MDGVSRIGVSLEPELLKRFDESISKKGYVSRSEAIRDLVRDSLAENEWKVGAGGKKQPRTRFYVKDIQYKEGKVSNLIIVDEAGRVRYTFGAANDDKFGAAILEVAAANDTEELKALYFKYEKEYKNDKRFIAAVNQRKAELAKAA
jgi:Arc/MetJ-type ribon-helix-helix transcriptional regulator